MPKLRVDFREKFERERKRIVSLVSLWRRLCIGVARGGGRPPPPIETLPMIKTSQKRLLFLQFQYVIASLRTTVQEYNSN